MIDRKIGSRRTKRGVVARSTYLSRRRRRALLLAAAMIGGGLTLSPSSAADTTDQVVLSDQAPSNEWIGTAGVPEPAHDPEGPCGPGCSEKLVRIDLDPSYWTNLAGALQVQLCTPHCDQDDVLADFDLYVYEQNAVGERRLAAFSAEGPSTADEIVGVGRPSGTYVVRVVTAAFLTVEPPDYHVKVALGKGTKFAAVAMGLRCSTAETRDSLTSVITTTFDSCSGFVRRLGEPPLFANLSFPTGTTEPLATITMLHGWIGTGGFFRTSTTDGCFEPPGGPICPEALYHYNTPWFVTRGYAVITYSARGHGSSCGLDQDPPAPANACTRGWAHVAQRSAEVADTQHLFSLAADAGIADPARLGVTGDSYGGGQSWMLATALPWKTPKGTALQLAAAAPNSGWTSFQNSVAPNGRATDQATQVPDALDEPYGVVKRGLLNELLLAPRQIQTGDIPCEVGPACGRFVRLNDTDPDERHSHVASWQAFWEAGEPYAPLGQSFSSAFRGKSAYHADDYLAAVANRTVAAVPIFALNGWSDTLFPAVETLQMYRRLKQAHPGYPIWMFFGDVGHGRPGDQASEEHLRLANDRRTAFFDRYLGGQSVDVGPKVASMRTSCDPATTDTSGVHASTWDLVRSDGITLSPAVSMGAATQTTSHAGRSAETDGAGDDPFGLACASSSSPTPGAARWTWSMPTGGATLLGLPTVSVNYTLTGVDATLIAKLWDVTPSTGSRTLITRGVYRLVDPEITSSGTVSFQLFGNHWRIDDGHQIELELMQSDAPVFQADKLASTLQLSAATVQLPTARHG